MREPRPRRRGRWLPAATGATKRVSAHLLGPRKLGEAKWLCLLTCAAVPCLVGLVVVRWWCFGGAGFVPAAWARAVVWGSVVLSKNTLLKKLGETVCTGTGAGTGTDRYRCTTPVRSGPGYRPVGRYLPDRPVPGPVDRYRHRYRCRCRYVLPVRGSTRWPAPPYTLLKMPCTNMQKRPTFPSGRCTALRQDSVHEPPSVGPFSSFHREPTLSPKRASIELDHRRVL